VTIPNQEVTSNQIQTVHPMKQEPSADLTQSQLGSSLNGYQIPEL
jgi:hypothetical protein